MTIRRIPKEDVQLGMFIQSLEGSWFDHPFWRSKFVLEDKADLDAIRSSNITGVVIDDSRGAAPHVTEDAPCADERRPAEPPSPPASTDRPASPVRRTDRTSEPESCSTSDEIDRAAAILDNSKIAVRKLFDDVRMGNAIPLREISGVADAISSSVARNPAALIGVARLREKDEYTYVHSVAVSALLICLGRQLELPEPILQELGVAGILHDIGKLAIPARLLNKPGPLTDGEFDIVRSHPERGYRYLSASGDVSEIALDICLHHHERVDGSGYPHRLKGDQLSLYAKMGAVCDVYDAVTSRRVYKSAWSPPECVSSMFRWKGHFDPDVLNAFIRCVGIYPVGSLVRLQSGWLALVTDHNAESLTQPVVRAFLSTDPSPRADPVDIDLRSSDDAIVGREDPQQWGFAKWDAEWRVLLTSGVIPTRLKMAG